MEITINDIIPLIKNENYKVRFIGEFWELKIRYIKLKIC